MAQITHLEVAQQFNGKGRLVYKTACGELLLGHAGVRKNIDKVSCFRCKRNLGVQVAAKVELKVEVKDCKTAMDWYQFAKKNNLRKLGQGASRKCYDLGDGRVVKVNYHGNQIGATDFRFGDQCAKEARVFANASEEKKVFLATILDSGDGWVIMEKARGIAPDFVSMEFASRIGEEITVATGIHDLHPYNIGYFGCGQFKILDYAL